MGAIKGKEIHSVGTTNCDVRAQADAAFRGCVTTGKELTFATMGTSLKNHPAENLLKPEKSRTWKCAAGLSDKQASVTLKFERLITVRSIDIGNAGSAFIEVLVARGDTDYKVLLVASSFMTPIESRNGSDLNRVRMFGPEKLNKQISSEKWDRIKIVCTQPFNKNLQYGLSFITVTTAEEANENTPKQIKLGSFTLREDDDESSSITIGSLFARNAALKAASASPVAASGSSSPSTGGIKRKAQENPPDVGFYQLKKKPVQESPVSTSSTPKLERDSSSSTPLRKDQSREKERSKPEKKPDKKEKREEKPEKTSSERRERKEEKVKREGSERRKDRDKPSTSKPAPEKKKKSKPFTSLMEGVVFVMSGYQNPQRANLRDMMLDMGANYKQDWDPKCTHLICAFLNTPKYQQVKGKGKIVTAKWISDCHKNKIRYPWRRYQLEKGQSGEESEEEVWAEEILPREERSNKSDDRKQLSPLPDANDDYNGATDSENENTDDEIERILAKKKKTKEKKNENSEEHNNNSQVKDESHKKKASAKRQHEAEEETPSKKPKKEASASTPKREASPEETKRQVNGKKKTLKKERESGESLRKTEVKEEKMDNGEANGTLPDSGESDYDADTDVDEENKKYLKRPDTSALQLPSLSDYFAGKTFFLYGQMEEQKRKMLRRYIIAYKGDVEDYMSEKVQYVITEDEWDDNFDSALEDNPSLQFVKPKWVWKCCDAQKVMPHQPFLVVPRE